MNPQHRNKMSNQRLGISNKSHFSKRHGTGKTLAACHFIFSPIDCHFVLFVLLELPSIVCVVSGVCMCVCVCVWSGNTKRESISVPLTSCLTGLYQSVLQIKTKIVSYHTADSKPVKQEGNGTVILPPLVFPGVVSDVCTCVCVCGVWCALWWKKLEITV